jgi:hypothetical protein
MRVLAPNEMCRLCGVSLRYLPASWRYCSQYCRDAAAVSKQEQRQLERLARAEQKEFERLEGIAERYERRLARIDERWEHKLDVEGRKIRLKHAEVVARPTVPYAVATANPYGRMKRQKEAQ